eukprot:CAMPEP_0179335950 /NCGR_PEP_ID=MMETSP0797-20121207/66768_1 /TAXON_ID=47934 /ORGANISM="Dinophysis acuminata, Strain DAEP01" /LENGTH=75 /DNA_ID=CAMNT_0021049375 /DNA_START=125 /DNA_END=348 /DNA_ORIENTATION=+
MRRGPGVKGTFVAMSKFAEEWTSQGKDKVLTNVTSELEVFGSLVCPAEFMDEGNKVVAAFADAELAKQAVQALHG